MEGLALGCYLHDMTVEKREKVCVCFEERERDGGFVALGEGLLFIGSPSHGRGRGFR